MSKMKNYLEDQIEKAEQDFLSKSIDIHGLRNRLKSLGVRGERLDEIMAAYEYEPIELDIRE